MATIISGIYLLFEGSTSQLASGLNIRELGYDNTSGVLTYLNCSGNPKYFPDTSNINTFINTNISGQKGSINGIAPLDGSGMIPSQYIPKVAITDVFIVNHFSDMLSLSTAEKGDVCKLLDSGETYILISGMYNVSGNWMVIGDGLVEVSSVNGQTGDVSLTYSDVSAAAAVHYHDSLYASGIAKVTNSSTITNISNSTIRIKPTDDSPYSGQVLTACDSSGTSRWIDPSATHKHYMLYSPDGSGNYVHVDNSGRTYIDSNLNLVSANPASGRFLRCLGALGNTEWYSMNELPNGITSGQFAWWNGTTWTYTNNLLTNLSGDLKSIKNVSYSWPSIQGAASTYLSNNGAGSLSWSTLPDQIIDGTVSGQLLRWDTNDWVAGPSGFLINSSGDISKVRNVDYIWPASQGSNSTYLKNDGAGSLSWASISSLGSTDDYKFFTPNALTTNTLFGIDGSTDVGYAVMSTTTLTRCSVLIKTFVTYSASNLVIRFRSVSANGSESSVFNGDTGTNLGTVNVSLPNTGGVSKYYYAANFTTNFSVSQGNMIIAVVSSFSGSSALGCQIILSS